MRSEVKSLTVSVTTAVIAFTLSHSTRALAQSMPYPPGGPGVYRAQFQGRPQGQFGSAQRAPDRPASAEANHVPRRPDGQEELTFMSHGNTLHGCITKPAGPGPFPAIIYNHGSEKSPPPCGPRELVRAYADRGYLVFAFQRHGHGQSSGEYIGDLEKQLDASPGKRDTRGQQRVLLQEVYSHDVVDAVQYLMGRPDVDRERIAMTGVSYGGIQTLLAAEKGLGLRAFVAFAPGAMSWGNQALQARLVAAVRNSRAPIYLAQAQNDFSVGPSEVLGPLLRAKGGGNAAKLYPPFGATPQEGHGAFAVRGGVPIWSPDVFAFLDRAMAEAQPAQNEAAQPTQRPRRFGHPVVRQGDR